MIYSKRKFIKMLEEKEGIYQKSYEQLRNYAWEILENDYKLIQEMEQLRNKYDITTEDLKKGKKNEKRR